MTEPRTTEEYSLKAGHLIGFLRDEAPLSIGLLEIGNVRDVEVLAYYAFRHFGRKYVSLFSQGNDTATKQDVGALLDTNRGWGVYGKASRMSELQKSISKPRISLAGHHETGRNLRSAMNVSKLVAEVKPVPQPCSLQPRRLLLCPSRSAVRNPSIRIDDLPYKFLPMFLAQN